MDLQAPSHRFVLMGPVLLFIIIRKSDDIVD